MTTNMGASALFGSYARTNGQKVTWFSTWHQVLDEALTALPEMQDCPHELYKALAINPGPTKKRIALVTREGKPVSVVALRKRANHWQPVTMGTTPGAVIPTADDEPWDALAALRTPIWALVRASPGEDAPITSSYATPEARAHLANDFEAYWREQHLHRVIRQARNAYRNSEIRVDGDGDAEWIVSMWAQFWHDPRRQLTVGWRDRILAAQYFRSSGRYRSICLLDGDERVAGNLFFVRGRELMGETTYRERTARSSPGVRLHDAAFYWARDEGYEYMNFGGSGFSYKTQWAPQDGAVYNVSVEPPVHRMLRRAREAQRRTAGALRQPATWARTRLR